MVIGQIFWVWEQTKKDLCQHPSQLVCCPRKNVRRSLESWTQGKYQAVPVRVWQSSFYVVIKWCKTKLCLLSSYQFFLSELLPSPSLHPPRTEHGAHRLSTFILEVLLSLYGKSWHEISSFLMFPTCPRPVILIPIRCVLLLIAVLCCPSLPLGGPVLISVPFGERRLVNSRKAPVSSLSFFLVFSQTSFQCSACWISINPSFGRHRDSPKAKQPMQTCQPNLIPCVSELNSRRPLLLQGDPVSGKPPPETSEISP